LQHVGVLSPLTALRVTPHGHLAAQGP
jgi:hypothetical protein